jgi:hypothetical protein
MVKNKLATSVKGLLKNPTEYRSIVGGLRYLVNTMPDLAYSVGILSRFLEEPREDHKAAVKHWGVLPQRWHQTADWVH